MLNISITDLYDLLSTKIGKEEAKAITNYIDTKIDKELENKSKVLATKDDIISLQKWMISLFITLSIMILGLYATILLKL